VISLYLVEAATRGLSLFNVIAFVWLGLAVLLNAERRTTGTLVAGSGLLLAGLFFSVHFILVGSLVELAEPTLQPWWNAIRLTFLIPPYMWYVAFAWYCGVLGSGRHRTWATLMGISCAAGAVAPTIVRYVPSYSQIVTGARAVLLGAAGIPGGSLIYPAFSILCFLLALDALRRPQASERFLGDMARTRARPWLVAASAALLLVAIVSGTVGALLLDGLQNHQLEIYSTPVLRRLMIVDLGVSALLGLVAVLAGKAIVSYEIFTGKTLPRGGLRRHWRNSLILAGGYGGLAAGCLALSLDPAYQLLLATLVIAVFYGLLSWRSYAARERGIEQLRPFVASQRLYEQILAPTGTSDGEARAAFHALCDGVLGARVACLAPLGPMAALAGPALTFPDGPAPPDLASNELAEQLQTARTICVPVDPERFSGAVWAIPLQSERGLIGVLLLGAKWDGGLYVQEEMEIARAACERLIDLEASAEMGRRLMALQRRQLRESQLLDQRARRVLHDEVLPSLHTALLALSGPLAEGSEGPSEAVTTLMEVHSQISKLLRAMPSRLAPEIERLGLVDALRQTVEVEMAGAFDGVSWQIEPEVEVVARGLPPLTEEVIYGAAREAIRNAARHGRDRDTQRPLHLAVSATAREGLRVEIEDDGVGLVHGGRAASSGGQGLALHSTMMAVMGGTLSMDSVPGVRTRISLTMPQFVDKP
jgi:signal transduction histidine kinase